MQGKWIKRAFPVMMTAVCAAAFIACGTNAVEDYDPVMEIDGQTVVKEEYQMILKEHTSEITQQYSTDEVNQKNFWSKRVDGEIPAEQLMELAKEDLIQRKTTAAAAEELEEVSGSHVGGDHIEGLVLLVIADGWCEDTA